MDPAGRDQVCRPCILGMSFFQPLSPTEPFKGKPLSLIINVWGKNMKKLLLVAALLISGFAQAQDRVVMNGKTATVNSDEAILVRTSSTPKKVKLKMLVPMANSTCLQYDTRYVIRTSGALCGYAVSERHIRERVCVKRDERNRCLRYENRVRVVRASTPRTCRIAERYCSDYGTATHREIDQVTIKFKNATNLNAGEEETFVVRAKQNRYGSSGIGFEIEPVSVTSDYEINDNGFLGFDTFVIQGK